MKTKTPCVSVILAYQDAESTLDFAVKSILNQTFTDFELILVNNNSNDQSSNIAWLLSGEDDRIILVSEHKKGISNALNTGIGIAKGDFIAFMDAKCFSHPERLEKQVNFMKENPVEVVSCLINYTPEDSPKAEIEHYTQWVNSLVSSSEIYNNRFIGMPVVTPSVMFKHNLVNEFGMFTPGDYPEEYEFWLRWLDYDVSIKKIPEFLLNWDNPETCGQHNSIPCHTLKTEYQAKWLRDNDHPYVWIWKKGVLEKSKVDYLDDAGIFIEGFIDVENIDFEDSYYVNSEEINWDALAFIIVFVDKPEERESIFKFFISKMKIETVNYIVSS